jgi:hypothetical protein
MAIVYGIPVLEPTMAEVFVFGRPMRFSSIIDTFSDGRREEYLCPTGVWDYVKSDWVTLYELGGDDVAGFATKRDKLLIFEDPALMIGFAQCNAKTLQGMYLSDRVLQENPDALFGTGSAHSCKGGYKVPAGMIGVPAVTGRMILSKNYLTKQVRYFLIPEAEYDLWASSSYDHTPFRSWLRINLKRHKEVPCYHDKPRKSNRRGK